MYPSWIPALASEPFTFARIPAFSDFKRSFCVFIQTLTLSGCKRWSSGKSYIASQLCKSVQEDGGVPMWIDLEKAFVFEHITEKNNIKFPQNLSLRNKTNYYAIMAVLFVAFLVLYASYLIINDDFRKKIKKIKKIK